MTHVLIVDDSMLTRVMVENIMHEYFPDWELTLAGNGEEALNLTSENSSIDAAILDFNMPGMNGLELGIALKEQRNVDHIALLTANVQNSIKNKAKTAGFTFINKPVNAEPILDFAKSI